MTMTLDSFYETLTKLDLIWSLHEHQGIRCEMGDCPILAVHRAKFGDILEDWDNECWESAAEELGLSLLEAELIINGADSSLGAIRPKLLTVCGITDDLL